ncbi:Clr5 domain-containing protein [Aspergillus thermomutatus]|uniref:Clr5 domain-containing protein n=1 Tax=Aspergillus thermomutatus TaxID=41047 RepID=A0A397G783_ASPTH|nr:uncharacterized protein CDV56_100382 [Aspergillus thermomutatus]RHZ45468.1 hypothetical protein CDV56_100382 [Aspergillus thermomutatus]
MGRSTINLEPYKTEILSLYGNETPLNTILEHIKARHNVEISKRTLESRLKDWGVRRQDHTIGSCSQLHARIRELFFQGGLEDKEILRVLDDDGFSITPRTLRRIRDQLGLTRCLRDPVEQQIQEEQMRQTLVHEAEQGRIQSFGKEILYRHMRGQGYNISRAIVAFYLLQIDVSTEDGQIIKSLDQIEQVRHRIEARTIASLNDLIQNDLLSTLAEHKYTREEGDIHRLATNVTKKVPTYLSRTADRRQAVEDLLQNWFECRTVTGGEREYYVFVIIERHLSSYRDDSTIKEEDSSIKREPASPRIKAELSSPVEKTTTSKRQRTKHTGLADLREQDTLTDEDLFEAPSIEELLENPRAARAASITTATSSSAATAPSSSSSRSRKRSAGSMASTASEVSYRTRRNHVLNAEDEGRIAEFGPFIERK